MEANLSPLGKTVTYTQRYDKSLLFALARKNKRDEIGITEPLPFQGMDIWNSYELSWLDPKGKPEVAIASFSFPCTSPFLIESKSFKLYLNSFNQSHFESAVAVQQTLAADLSAATHSEVTVTLTLARHFPPQQIAQFEGTCLDEQDIRCDTYQVAPQLLSTGSVMVTETLYSDLLKSNCLVTGQPDWGSIQICYTGRKIDHPGLLRYLVSFRNHNEFHEQCVERIFSDIMRHCSPQALTVYARYTRRGGLDINPFRSTEHAAPSNERLCRQ